MQELLPEVKCLRESGYTYRQIAEKLAHRKGVKTSVKYKVIYRHREKYGISEMCRFFGVSRSGYYDSNYNLIIEKHE